VAIEIAILILFGAVTYGVIVFAFRPRRLRAFWVMVGEN
jgi:cbb3-type cytochrome oxidase subunit 3